ncbi:hypothetical protein NADFUDRAFT_82498 [Nadsonia fulvescens var. elongata DSM 6958]|uniref:SMP-LTD domain-containing protein n=1 Tax=Nadsonia fulvescens var. elongata DSM 6958 TaxID=857566 RepID=A0A1E3PMW9_9ASCO|nr:hypothetical protein NADFUDRAFT_82498 [Nadsonia fulvescens var. elongata DSM 6958]
MGSFTVFVISYLLGGVTLIPLLVVAVFIFSIWYLPYVDTIGEKSEHDNHKNKLIRSLFESKIEKMEQDHHREEMAQFFSDYEDSDNESHQLHSDANLGFSDGGGWGIGSDSEDFGQDTGIALSVYKTGWITVTREYFIYPDGGPNGESGVPAQAAITANESAYSSLYKLITKDKTEATAATLASEKLAKIEKKTDGCVAAVVDGKTITNTGPTSISSTATTLTTQTTTQNSMSSPTSFLTFNSTASSTKKTKKSLRKHKFFYMLKHGNLFLYKDEEQQDVQQVIVMANQSVSLWPPNQIDGQLFIKRTAIFLQNIVPKGASSISTNLNPSKGYYIFLDNCYEKEDLYYDLICASKASGIHRHNRDNYNQGIPNPRVLAQPIMYKETDMILLIQKLHSSKSNLQTRWLNAVIGRLFLGVYKTKAFRDGIEAKIIKKLSKIKKPGFLSDIQVRNISTGHATPFITHPKLKELTPEGQLIAEFHLNYSGHLSLEVETSVNINLGSRFKARRVAIVLTVTIQKLEGDIRLVIKEPPTNRIWYAFTQMPKLKLLIEPVVSSRQITYSMVTKTIESKIRQAIKESLVMPFMDDIVFMGTEGEIFRGGLWDPSVRKDEKAQQEGIHVSSNINLKSTTANHAEGEGETGSNANTNLTGDDEDNDEDEDEDDTLAAATFAAKTHRKKSINELTVPTMRGFGRGSSNRSASPSASSISSSAISMESMESTASLVSNSTSVSKSKISRSSTSSSTSSALASTVKATSSLGSKLAKKIRKTATSASTLIESTTHRGSESDSGNEAFNDSGTVKKWGNYFSEKKSQIKQRGFSSANGNADDNVDREAFNDMNPLTSLSSLSSSLPPSFSPLVADDRTHKAPTAHNFPPEMLSLINQTETAKTTTTTMETKLETSTANIQQQRRLRSKSNGSVASFASISSFESVSSGSSTMSNILDPYQPTPAMSVPKKYPVPSHHHHSPSLATVNIEGQRTIMQTETKTGKPITRQPSLEMPKNENTKARSKSVKRKPVGGYNSNEEDEDVFDKDGVGIRRDNNTSTATLTSHYREPSVEDNTDNDIITSKDTRFE